MKAAISRSRPFVVLEYGRQSSRAFGMRSKHLKDLRSARCGLDVSLLPDWLQQKRLLTRREFVEQRERYFLAHPIGGKL